MSKQFEDDTVIVLATLALVAGILASTSHPLPAAAEAGIVTPSQVVDDSAIPDCEVEDGSSGPIPCRWDAGVLGNGIGESFTITSPGVFVYDDGHIERD
jgi:hypothetical protein